MYVEYEEEEANREMDEKMYEAEMDRQLGMMIDQHYQEMHERYKITHWDDFEDRIKDRMKK